jgi:hypothetical protein
VEESMIWEFIFWIIAVSFGVLSIGIASLIVWGLWREMKKRH